jgi:hypothetical protein
VRKPIQLSSLMLPNKWNISSLSGKMFFLNRSRYRHYHLFTGRPAHSIRNRFIEKYLESNTKPPHSSQDLKGLRRISIILIFSLIFYNKFMRYTSLLYPLCIQDQDQQNIIHHYVFMPFNSFY